MMPDLPGRTQRERELTAALLVVFADWKNRPFDQRAFASDVQRAIQPVMGRVHIEAAEQMVAIHGATIGDIEQRGQRWAETMAATFAGEMASTTGEILRQAEIGQADRTTAFNPDRAEMMAVTEVSRAISAGEMAVAIFLAGLSIEDGGQRLIPIWYTEADGRVCPICQPLHRTRKAIWGQIAPGGPGAHPRCRCHLIWEAV